MSPLSPLQLSIELAYRRRVLFALELLDPVTLERVSQGFTVMAEGLRGKPVLNSSGLFVWLDEDFGKLRRILIDPGIRPYERIELTAAQVQLGLNVVQMPPRPNYPFSAGITGLRGTLIESRVAAPQTPLPVTDAEVRLQWKDDGSHWHDSPTTTHTDPTSGDFVSILRLTPNVVPHPEEPGFTTVRLRVSREGGSSRISAKERIPQGRIADNFADPPNSTNLKPFIFAWDELQP